MMYDQAELRADRAHVVRLAYRMLGSVSDAEDVAQECFVRLESTSPAELRSRRAWLTTAASRLCIDRLRARERRREEYVGVDLPEPFLDEELREWDDSLSLALLATVQRLNATERAVFLLHDVFDHPFDEVGAMLELRTDHCRQLAVRARKHLQLGAVRTDASPSEVERLTEAFFRAIEEGEMSELRDLLGEDVELRSDGGGRVAAALLPIYGRDRVLRFLQGVLTKWPPSPGESRRATWFNGAPGVLVCDADGAPITAFQFLVVGGRILGIYAQRNPDKLKRFVS
jgi:RNA polymerase sigma-70 factor, ECF subfamily